MQAKLQSSINFFQFEYCRKISKKLIDLSTTSKCYWTQLLNGRKILCAPPLFHDSKFIITSKSKKSKLNSKKAYSDDMISMRMRKLCDKSTSKPLNIIFKSCLTQSIFPSECKKTNLVPIHKKNDKQCVKNYRPVSLLSICRKFFRTYCLQHDINIVCRKQPNIRKPIRF